MKRNDGSWDIFDDYVLDFALDRVPAGHAVALVTLIRIEGASPRPLGARDAGWQEIFNTMPWNMAGGMSAMAAW